MSDDGTSFSIDLPVTGQSGIDAAAASMDVLANRLGDASKASIATSSSMSAAEASYRTAEASADRAAKALERIGMAADAQRGKLQQAMDTGDTSGADRAAAKLANLMDRQSEAAAKAQAAKSALDEEAMSLDRLKDSAAAAAAENQKLADTPPPKAEEASGGGGGDGPNFEMMSRGLSKLGGPLGDAGSKVTGLIGGMGKLGESFGAEDGEAAAATGGLSVLVTVMAAVTAAAVAGVIQLGIWAVGLSDANRSALLLNQGIAGTVAGGAMLNDKINSLASTLPLSNQELSGMAQNLAKSGLQGQALTDALDKSATAAAKLKFGPDFEKQMLSADEQSKVFHANLGAVFGGLNTDGLMGALQKIVGLFDANSASGKALKVVFESIFQPIIDKITALEPMVEKFFLQFEIMAMKAMLAIKPYGSVIEKVGEALLIAAGIIVGVVVVAIGILLSPIFAAIAALTEMVLVVEFVVDAFVAGFGAVKAFLANFSLAAMGKQMIDGLVQGIVSGGAAILSAITGAVGGAVTAAKKALGIASPSKVFAEIGMQTGAGMAHGVDKSSDGVQDSLESMVSPPSAGAGKGGPPAAGAASSGKGGASITGNTFIFNGVEGAEDAESKFTELFIRFMEGNVTQMGGSVPQV